MNIIKRILQWYEDWLESLTDKEKTIYFDILEKNERN